MATYTATGAQASVQPKGLRVGLVAVKSIYSIGAVSLSAGDIVQMVKVPANSTPIVIQYGCSNASDQYLLHVGDGINTQRYRSYSTYSAAFGMAVAGLAGSGQVSFLATTPYTYSADDTIDIFLSTITATSTIGGAFYMNAIFSMDP